MHFASQNIQYRRVRPGVEQQPHQLLGRERRFKLGGGVQERRLAAGPANRSRFGAAFRSFWLGEREEEEEVSEAVPAFARALEERIGRGLFEALWERGVLGATLAQVEIEARLAENR